jgi:Tol biopolymer transport system component/DNA-binding winged helix-turn-helix (wHTH) protein
VQKLPIDGLPNDDEGRPGQSPTALVYRFGPYELDLSRYDLRRGEHRVPLARAPMDLLVLLVQRRYTLLSREEIAARLWAAPGMVDVDQGINTAIRRIREVLLDDPAKPCYVETVIGKGYRFIAEVKESRRDATLFAMPPRPGVQDEPEPELDESPGPGEPSQALEPSEPAEPPANPILQPQIQERESKPRVKRFIIPAAIALFLILGIAYAAWSLLKLKAVRYSSSLVQITTNDSEQRVTAAAISPDGKWIAYADFDGVALRTLRSGETTILKGPANFWADHIAWFPDQTRLLLSGLDTQTASPQIWTIFATGNAPQLFRKDARNGLPSPDGARIMFTTGKDRELWTSGAAGEGARLLIADRSGRVFTGLFWSRDAKRISYLRRLAAPGNDDRYETADADSGNVLTAEQGVTYESAYPLADGRVFLLRDASDQMNDAYSLSVVDTNTADGSFISAPQQIASLDRGRAFALTGSEDGKKLSIVFEKGEPHVYVGTLHQPGPTLTDVQRLTYDTRIDYPHAWLPDNQTVLFESNRTGFYRIYGQRLGDHIPQEITTGAGQAVLPQVTPDGKWILYGSKPHVLSSPEDKLFRIPVGGGSPAQVAIGGPLEEFECPLLSGTDCVLLKSEERKSLIYYALNPVTGKGRELARTSWMPHFTQDWGVSPDGSAVALAVHDAGNPRIRIVPLNKAGGLYERELPVSGYGKPWGITWSADGKGWYVATQTGVGTLLLFVNSRGESHILRETPLGTWGVPSPDGSKLAFVDKAVDSNVWMWRVEGDR